MIAVCIFFSEFSKEEDIRKQYEFFEKKYSEDVKIFYFRADQTPELPTHLNGIIVHPATGGTERAMLSVLHLSSVPLMIIAKHSNNSLAAAIETYSHIKDSHPVIFHSFTVKEDINLHLMYNFITICHAINEINHSYLGMIGNPSDWLVTSDNFKLNKKFFPHLKKFQISELIKMVEEISDEEVANFDKSMFEMNEIPDSELSNSLKMYYALKKLIAKNNLSGLTIKCFDLLETKITACLAFAILNKEGITATCEGDLTAYISMLVGSKLTNQSCWMANPSKIDYKKNILTIAHCTAPIDFYEDKVRLDTHMESGLSVATSGKIKHQEATIFRFNSVMNKLVLGKGKILESDFNDRNLCRTQIEFKFDGDINEWLHKTPGNHQVILYGDKLQLFKDFCILTNVEYIRI